MPQHLTLITGASRGLGHAMAQQRLQAGHRLLTISRSATVLPVPEGAVHEDWQADLAEPGPLARRLRAWLAGIDPLTLASVTLIHNAGVISKLAPLSAYTADEDAELARALRVGLEAPLVLSAAFLHATAAWASAAVPRKLLFISSGLGRSAMAGSASYCAAKAGMDHLARALALEEAATPHGARVASMAPGVIDTDMQVQLRAADPALFADHSRFVGLQAGGLLDSPAQAATKVLRLLDRADFGQTAITDVRQA